jgi:hypothetical protein
VSLCSFHPENVRAAIAAARERALSRWSLLPLHTPFRALVSSFVDTGQRNLCGGTRMTTVLVFCKMYQRSLLPISD